MSDRIDTDAARGNVEQLRGCADADLGSHDVRWCLAVMDRLLDEVDALRSREVPDGHVRIDGTLYRVERVSWSADRAEPEEHALHRLVPVEEP